MNDGDLPETCHVGVVQVFIDVHDRLVQRLALYIDRGRAVLRLAAVQTAVFRRARRFFLFAAVADQHQILHIGIDLHDAYADHQIAPGVRQRQHLAVLIERQQLDAVADLELFREHRVVVDELFRCDRIFVFTLT